ncbi:unnamed protein product [Amoebophrya sp. A25]|nr:unnamed protein product [Amoebophrya sp. A25]|eukprot:GSA25T00020022001.1
MLTWGRWFKFLEKVGDYLVRRTVTHGETGTRVIRCNLDETFLRFHVAQKNAVIPEENARRVNRNHAPNKKTTKGGCTFSAIISDAYDIQFKPTIILNASHPRKSWKVDAAKCWEGSAYVIPDGNENGHHQTDSSLFMRTLQRVAAEKAAHEKRLGHRIVIQFIVDVCPAHTVEDSWREEWLEERHGIYLFWLQPEVGSKLQPLDCHGILSSIKNGQAHLRGYHSLLSPAFRDFTLAVLRLHSRPSTFEKFGFHGNPRDWAPMQSELRKFLLDLH